MCWRVSFCPRIGGGIWPDAAFGFDLEQEDARLLAIERHVQELLNVADVIGLQEVPAALVKQLVRKGEQQAFEVQWLSAPSDKDAEWYVPAAGRRGRSSEGEPASSLPPVAHDMMFCRDSLCGPPEDVR